MFNSRNKACTSRNFKSRILNFSLVIKQDIDVLKVLKLKLIAGIRYVSKVLLSRTASLYLKVCFSAISLSFSDRVLSS